MSHIVAMLSAMFPEGEDFFVRSVRHYADRITDPELKAQVAGFIGQEVTHGREHRALNDRLQQLGYPTASGRPAGQSGSGASPTASCRRRSGSRSPQRSSTTPRSLAETLLTDEQAPKHSSGRARSGRCLLWHALEESEHKSVAFDVYRAVGGTEKMRIRVMRMVTVAFLLGTTLQTIASMLADRATYHPIRLLRSLLALRHSPLLSQGHATADRGVQPASASIPTTTTTRSCWRTGPGNCSARTANWSGI